MQNRQDHSQFEVTPYPSSLRSGWMPEPGSDAWGKFHDWLIAQIDVEASQEIDASSVSPAVWDLYQFLTENDVVATMMAQACRQNAAMRATQGLDSKTSGGKPNPEYVPIPWIPNAIVFSLYCQILLTRWPHFIDDELVGLPFSGMTVGIDPTLAGSQLLSLPQFNEKMGAVLDEWHTFLASPDSAGGFAVDGEQWLSPKAKETYKFDDWATDNTTVPYWNSWNSFFTREFKDPANQRPIAGPDTNQIVNCPNDGSLFRWDYQVAADNTYWFKDMNYSIRDILSSPDPVQQATIEEYGLVDMFTGGYIFQTYLNPYNFHRWWIPANGEVLFDPIAVPGAYFAKLVLPDFTGATTASLPYLCEINARGIIVIKTPDYGHVCCIPLGMSEVSTIEFDSAMTKGASVTKGQEMGMFNYGGSSFAILYENLPDKQLIFMEEDGTHMPQRPVLPSGSASTGGVTTSIGAQIGVWYSR